MTAVVTQLRSGAYADSVVLMQLQSELSRLDSVLDVAVAMGTKANLELLQANNLLTKEAASAGTDDLVVVIRAESPEFAEQALTQIDSLLERGSESDTLDYHPKSLQSAIKMLPNANWVLISVPGKWAADVAHQALDRNLNVFLYSDNVTLEDEVSLKTRSSSIGRLVLGPDCGTALIDGVGFGFANRVRRGSIGIVAASGTGIQAITSRIHQLGEGVSQAIGTGGRDLYEAVRAQTAAQALDLLARDPATDVIVLASKPPEAEVAAQVLRQAMKFPKPVVVQFSGYSPPASQTGNLHFARSLSDAADLAVELSRSQDTAVTENRYPSKEGFLRGLFAGGTLALEAVQGLSPFLRPLYSNLPSSSSEQLSDPTNPQGHTILDLGADEFTVGRLHPMMDQLLRLQILERESADPAVGVLLLDVVLGAGAHPDPAAELAPAIARAIQSDEIEVVVVVIGTDEDPQDLASTVERLEAAGARVFTSVSEAVASVGAMLAASVATQSTKVELESIAPPKVVNIGLETFYQDLLDQEVDAVQVDWRPPAGGNEKLISILEKMKS